MHGQNGFKLYESSKMKLEKEENHENSLGHFVMFQDLVMIANALGNLQECVWILGLDWGRLELCF